MTAEPPARRPRFPLALDGVSARKTAAPGRAPGGAPSAAGATSGRAAAPPRAGVGLDSQAVRARMVERLRREPGLAEPVLAALGATPRHAFVDTALVAQAYEDTSLPIGHGQTISKPSVVARMLSLLFEGESARSRGGLGRTLEIGTGCGYQAALLARLSASVVSVERLKPLHDKAREHLAQVRRDNVRLVWGDGRLGHPPNAPYDSIIAAAGGEDLPQAWLDQLALGGRLVAPMAQGGAQVLVVVDRTPSGWVRRVHENVRFVPLRSGVA